MARPVSLLSRRPCLPSRMTSWALEQANPQQVASLVAALLCAVLGVWQVPEAECVKSAEDNLACACNAAGATALQCTGAVVQTETAADLRSKLSCFLSA